MEASVYTNRMEIDISNGTTYLNFCGTLGSTFESPERSSSRARLNQLMIVVAEFCQPHGPMKLLLSCKRLWIVRRSKFATGLLVRLTDNRSILPAHDGGLTYTVYHTEKPIVFEVFDNQGNIIGVGPWYRRDRHENYAKGSRVKNPGKNNQMR